jgi:hypothetical protein
MMVDGDWACGSGGGGSGGNGVAINMYYTLILFMHLYVFYI